jgi:hypothetical protein
MCIPFDLPFQSFESSEAYWNQNDESCLVEMLIHNVIKKQDIEYADNQNKHRQLDPSKLVHCFSSLFYIV